MDKQCLFDIHTNLHYNTIVSSSLMTFDTIASATLERKDWDKILLALETYVIQKENQLIKENAGEREWSDLEDYNVLIRDIQLYCIR